MGKKTNKPTISVDELMKRIKKEISKANDITVRINDVNIDRGETIDFHEVIPFNKEADISFENVSFNDATDIIAPSDTSLTFRRCAFKFDVDFKCGALDIVNCKSNDITVYTNHYDVNLSNIKSKSPIRIDVNDARNVTLDKCEGIGHFFNYHVTSSVSIYGSKVAEVSIHNGPSGLIRIANSKIEDLDINDVNIDRISVKNSEISNSMRIKRSSILNDIDVKTTKIEKLVCDKAAFFGEVFYEPDEIKRIDCDETVGLKPPENEFTMYKTCHARDKDDCKLDQVIVQLTVPAKADRVYCGQLKIRVSEAKVVKFLTADGKPFKPKRNCKVSADFDHRFVYKLGETVKPVNPFNPESGACGSGIHGFVKFSDAVNYE
jgi:hypothetical protein